MEERYLKHDLSERIVHWTMALSVIVLIKTGLNIRYPGLIPFVSMNHARFMHFAAMYGLIFSWVFHVYHTLAVERRNEVAGWKDLKAAPKVLKYYLFLTDEHPLSTKYNALQKMTYNLLWAFIAVQVATGLILYWPSELMAASRLAGGLMAVRVLHDFMTYVFISFLIVHVYLVLSDDIRALWAMFHGYYYRRVQR